MSRLRFFTNNSRSVEEIEVIRLQALITQYQNTLSWKKFELQNQRSCGIFHKNKNGAEYQDFIALQNEIEKQEKIKIEYEMKLCELKNEYPSNQLKERAEHYARDQRLHVNLYSPN